MSLPYDLIYDYVYKPVPAVESSFARRKLMLLNYAYKLRDMGKSLENERPLVAQIKGFSGFTKRRTFNRKMRIYETKSLLAETEFSLMEMEADYFKKVEPLTYTFKLILGIICILMTLNWFA